MVSFLPQINYIEKKKMERTYRFNKTYEMYELSAVHFDPDLSKHIIKTLSNNLEN